MSATSIKPRAGDILVVGLNTDASVKRLEKAPGRPIVGQKERAEF